MGRERIVDVVSGKGEGIKSQLKRLSDEVCKRVRSLHG